MDISVATKSNAEKSSLLKRIFRHRNYYLMLLPAIAYYVIFCYLPMGGVTLAFKSYNFSKGIFGSPWVGLRNFELLLTDKGFLIALKNTLILSICKTLIHFPAPIILAILLNELSKNKLRKVYQTFFTFPHFISWIVLSGIVANMFSQNGIYNQISSLFGVSQSLSPLVSTESFRPIVYISYVWKEMGWDSIIYLAALAGINPELYESASIDGANRFQRILHITWPCIRSTTAILLILNIGQIMSGVSFDQIFNLYSSPVYSVADTMDTYIYRETFTAGMDYGYSTAIGLIKSVVNMVLVVVSNKIVTALGEDGLF